MREALPQSVDPHRLAELHRELTGSLPLARLPRLARVVVDTDNPDPRYAAFELVFRRDANGRDVVEGRVEATLRLRCERCNGVLELPVSSRFTLAVVEGLDEAAQLPDAYDPLIPDGVSDGATRAEVTVDPTALVEDELLLAVPTVPRHPENACRAPVYDTGAAPTDDAVPGDPHPFAVLEALKRHH